MQLECKINIKNEYKMYFILINPNVIPCWLVDCRQYQVQADCESKCIPYAKLYKHPTKLEREFTLD